jgi:hypothetical protein
VGGTASSLLFGHPYVGNLIGNAASNGVFGFMDKLMSNPKTAQAMIDLSKNTSNNAIVQRVLPIITNSLKGSAGLNINGQPASVDHDGNLNLH